MAVSIEGEALKIMKMVVLSALGLALNACGVEQESATGGDVGQVAQGLGTISCTTDNDCWHFCGTKCRSGLCDGSTQICGAYESACCQYIGSNGNEYWQCTSDSKWCYRNGGSIIN